MASAATTTEAPRVREATIDDVPHILDIIRALADYEKLPERVEATEDSLRQTLTFAPSPSNPSPAVGYARTFLVYYPAAAAQPEQVAGMALFFNNYSTWLSVPGIYLEDLFIKPEFRRRGLATLLFKALADEVKRISGGRGRLEWSCLKWNEPALAFYRQLGGITQDEWVGVRVEGEQALEKLANAEAK